MTDRDALAELLIEAAIDGMGPRETAVHLVGKGVRPPARVITDQRLIANEATGTILRSEMGEVITVNHGRNGEWTGPHTRLWFQDLAPSTPMTVGDLELLGNDWTVLYVPTEEADRG